MRISNQSDSVLQFERARDSAFKTFRNALDRLLRVFIREDQKAKEDAIQAAHKATLGLKNILAHNDQPSWLHMLESSLRGSYGQTAKPENREVLHNNLIVYKPVIDKHTWRVVGENVEGTDFDKIFEDYRKESRLPELFVNLIELLDKILNSGEVDSIKLTKALQKIRITLESNKEGSYFSTRAAVRFVTLFLKKAVWKNFAALPGLGPTIDAFFEASEELWKEMKEVDARITQEVGAIVDAEIDALPAEYKQLTSKEQE